MINLEPLPFRLLIDRIIDPIRRCFLALFLPTALPLVAAGLMMVVLQRHWIRAFTGTAGSDSLSTLGLVALLFLVALLVYALAYGALLVGSMDAAAGRPVRMGRAWLLVLRPAVLGTLIIVSLASFTSFMMCFLPALYVVPVLAFVLPAMVEENVYGVAAILRSVELTHFNPTGRVSDSVWLQIVVMLLIGMAIQYAVALAVQMPLMVLQQVWIFRNAASGEDPTAAMLGPLWLQLAIQVLGGLATAAAWLYWTVGTGMLYFDVRRRREGDDLRRAIDELTGAEQGDQLSSPAVR